MPLHLINAMTSQKDTKLNGTLEYSTKSRIILCIKRGQRSDFITRSFCLCYLYIAIDLQCYGHYPYVIEWRVSLWTIEGQEIKDESMVEDPPLIFLFVIADDWDSLSVADLSNPEQTEEGGSVYDKAGANIYDDQLADPKCIPKFEKRKREEALTAGGPEAQLAQPLKTGIDQSAKQPMSMMSMGGGKGEYKQMVTSHNTIHNPAELHSYLKDYRRFMKEVCRRDSSQKGCPTPSPTVYKAPTAAPTEYGIAPVKHKKWYDWQNIVVYLAAAMVIRTFLDQMGWFEKSLETRVVEAQMRAMAHLPQ